MLRRAVQKAINPLKQLCTQLTETTSLQQLGKSDNWRQRAVYRQLFSSAESGQGGAGSSSAPPKSMLDASWSHAGAPDSALGGAAAARMRVVAAAEPAQGAANATAAAGGAGRAASGRSLFAKMFDFALYSSLAAAAAVGVVYSRYSIEEVEHALREAEQQQQQQPSLVTQAWTELIRSYLSVAVPMDRKVCR